MQLADPLFDEFLDEGIFARDGKVDVAGAAHQIRGPSGTAIERLTVVRMAGKRAFVGAGQRVAAHRMNGHKNQKPSQHTSTVAFPRKNSIRFTQASNPTDHLSIRCQLSPQHSRNVPRDQVSGEIALVPRTQDSAAAPPRRQK